MPGASSKAILLPDNTVQSMDLDYVRRLLQASVGCGEQNPDFIFYGRAWIKKPAGYPAGCRTCRHKPGGVPAFAAAAQGLRRMVFHLAGTDKLEGSE